MTPEEIKAKIETLEKEKSLAMSKEQYHLAANIRDQIIELNTLLSQTGN